MIITSNKMQNHKMQTYGGRQTNNLTTNDHISAPKQTHGKQAHELK